MSFLEEFERHQWDDVSEKIYSKRSSDVESALSNAGNGNFEDFLSLVSPAAADYLEDLAQTSQKLTLQRFGKTIQMFLPMYLSNECKNVCTYCGFSQTNMVPRKTLSDEEILAETRHIKKMGYDHLLLVTGEDNKNVNLSYFENALKLIRPYFSNISLEVQPLETAEYESLIKLGLYSVLVYQETYNKRSYKDYHPKGKKSLMDFRLETPDRLGEAKIHKIGLGCLLGLEDWRVDSSFVALHLLYLKKKYWQTKYSVSFPRIRPSLGDFIVNKHITDKELVQLICAYRIFDENLELSLSTRESQNFRDHVIKLGITSMSAGSKTDPGGYTLAEESLEQFEIDDHRSPQEIAYMIAKSGYEVVWKDWDKMI